MYKLKALDRFEISGRGTAYVVESPVSTDRTFAAMSGALGPQIEIDGQVFTPIGYEMNMPATKVFIGEKISIIVRSNEQT